MLEPGTSSLSRHVDDVMARPKILSPRLLEVALLVATGLTDKQMAVQLSLAPNTISSYVRRICEKLGLHRRSEIATWVANLTTQRPYC
jgi:DNA-binding CsgD family transcriptional regulator